MSARSVAGTSQSVNIQSICGQSAKHYKGQFVRDKRRLKTLGNINTCRNQQMTKLLYSKYGNISAQEQRTPTSFARCQFAAALLISATVHTRSHGFVAPVLTLATPSTETALSTGPFICITMQHIW